MNILDYIGWRHQRGRTSFVIKLILFTILLWSYYYRWEYYEKLEIKEHYITAVLFYLGSNLLINFARFILSHIYVLRIKKSDFGKDNFLFGLTRITSIFNIMIFGAAVFLFFDIDYKAVFTSLSIIAAAIAILSKDYISNMINGMIIMFTDQISLGDFIKIGDHRGTVMDITFVNIHILDENGDLVFYPNSFVFSHEVVNYSKRDINKINIYFEMDVEKINDVEKLEEFIKSNLKSYQGFIQPNSYFLRTIEIKKDLAEFSFQYIIKKHDLKIEKEIRKTVMRNLVKYIESHQNFLSATKESY